MRKIVGYVVHAPEMATRSHRRRKQIQSTSPVRTGQGKARQDEVGQGEARYGDARADDPEKWEGDSLVRTN